MRLQQIVDILVSTELKQIVTGEDDAKVLSLLNLALMDVYARFAILQEEQLINVVAGKTRYRLQDNSQKILQVYLYDDGDKHGNINDNWKEVPINDINCDYSIFTPQPYVVHIPNPVEGRKYSIVQLVTPPYITASNIGTTDFTVPPQLLEPIVNYVAYRAYKSMNGDEATEIGSHYRAYENSCKNVLKRGLLNSTIITNLKLTHRGF